MKLGWECGPVRAYFIRAHSRYWIYCKGKMVGIANFDDGYDKFLAAATDHFGCVVRAMKLTKTHSIAD